MQSALLDVRSGAAHLLARALDEAWHSLPAGRASRKHVMPCARGTDNNRTHTAFAGLVGSSICVKLQCNVAKDRNTFTAKRLLSQCGVVLSRRTRDTFSAESRKLRNANPIRSSIARSKALVTRSRSRLQRISGLYPARRSSILTFDAPQFRYAVL